MSAEFDLKGRKVKISNKTKGDTTIFTPNIIGLDSVNVIDNKVVYSGKDAKADVVVEAIDGGVRQVINIKSSDAPSSYDFPIELTSEEKLVLNEDGSAMVTKPLITEEKNTIPKDLPRGVKIPNFSTKLYIAKPWAKDANGKDLKTNYTINGNTLTQKIELAGAVFPVVADPSVCGNVINSVSWGWNGNLRSLSVNPTGCGRFIALNPYTVGFNFWFMWGELYDKTPYDSYWNYVERAYGTSKYWSMYDQYICHLNLSTTFKGTYNLEPTRPNVGLSAVIGATCNPN